MIFTEIKVIIYGGDNTYSNTYYDGSIKQFENTNTLIIYHDVNPQDKKATRSVAIISGTFEIVVIKL